jgi:redox-sensitive bicupin YhaK (pirin superfamily)
MNVLSCAASRALSRVIQLPPPARGQLGPNHTVVEVLRPDAWAEQDPFILLMDDRLDGRLEAGPHPHAGFETVTFPLEGAMESEGGVGRLQPGDVEWTTAGSGIIHGPERPVVGHFRLLQLWLTLPKRARWTKPDNQIIPGSGVPVRREPGAEVRLYSGTTGALVSPTRNRVPVTLLDVRLESGDSVLTLANEGPAPMRLRLYAGERQGVPIFSYGPFIGDTGRDIERSFQQYRAGTFQRY